MSRSTRSASTAPAMPPFMSQAPLPVSRSPSTAAGTKGRWTVSRWPLNCKVGPGRPDSSRTTTAGRGGMAGGHALDPEAIRGQDLAQAVGDDRRLAGSARDGNELRAVSTRRSRLTALRRRSLDCRGGVHGGGLYWPSGTAAINRPRKFLLHLPHPIPPRKALRGRKWVRGESTLPEVLPEPSPDIPGRNVFFAIFSVILCKMPRIVVDRTVSCCSGRPDAICSGHLRSRLRGQAANRSEAPGMHFSGWYRGVFGGFSGRSRRPGPYARQPLPGLGTDETPRFRPRRPLPDPRSGPRDRRGDSRRRPGTFALEISWTRWRSTPALSASSRSESPRSAFAPCRDQINYPYGHGGLDRRGRLRLYRLGIAPEQFHLRSGGGIFRDVRARCSSQVGPYLLRVRLVRQRRSLPISGQARAGRRLFRVGRLMRGYIRNFQCAANRSSSTCRRPRCRHLCFQRPPVKVWLRRDNGTGLALFSRDAEPRTERVGRSPGCASQRVRSPSLRSRLRVAAKQSLFDRHLPL